MFALLAAYCCCILLASLAGGWLPLLVRLTHTRMQLLMSFVGGFMLAIAILHLIPHAIAECDSPDQVAYATITGLLVTFFMIRVFHVHQHGHEVGDGHKHKADTCEHEHAEHSHGHSHRLSWSGLFFGLALHTFFDGIALGAGVKAGWDNTAVGIAGIGTFLAIVLHKPLDALSITCVMSGSGWSRRSINLANVAFASMCPLGALAVVLGINLLGAAQPMVIGWALGFAAGIFLCISLADILPELQFHQHDRLRLSLVLLLGVLLALLVGFIEPPHGHNHEAEHGPHEAGAHDHNDEDHGDNNHRDHSD
jgi:zinc and cadmium transporter